MTRTHFIFQSLALGWALLSNSAALARDIEVDIEFTIGQAPACVPERPCVPWGNDLVIYEQERFPMVAQKVLRFPLRPDEIIDSAVLEFAQPQHLDYELPITPRYQVISLQKDPRWFVTKYRGETYPKRWIEPIQIQYQRGIPIATVRIFPMRVKNYSHIEYLSTAKLKIQTREGQMTNSLLRAETRDVRLANVGAHQSLSLPLLRNQQESGLLIVAPAAVVGENAPAQFADYQAMKVSQGFIPKIATTESIANGGTLTAEKLRAFIREQYKTNNIDYVLLVGSKNVIPWKTLRSGISGNGDPIPSDQYYACLDGDFTNFQNYDWACEVGVGRIGADSANAFAAWLDKTISLEKAALGGETAHLLHYGEKMDASTLAGWVLDYLVTGSARQLITVGFGDTVKVDNLYDTFSVTKTGDDFIQRLGKGGHYIVNHLGHANNDYVFRLNANRIADLPEIPGFFYSQGCYPNNPDVLNWTVQATRTQQIGPAAMITNTRYGWYGPGQGNEGPSNVLHRAFWSVYLKDDVRTIGMMNHKAKELVNAAAPGNLMRYVLLESNLIGDPTIDLLLRPKGH